MYENKTVTKIRNDRNTKKSRCTKNERQRTGKQASYEKRTGTNLRNDTKRNKKKRKKILCTCLVTKAEYSQIHSGDNYFLGK